MFNLRRQQVLDECGWAPREGQLRYIEAQTFANSGKLVDQNLWISIFHSGYVSNSCCCRYVDT